MLVMVLMMPTLKLMLLMPPSLNFSPSKNGFKKTSKDPFPMEASTLLHTKQIKTYGTVSSKMLLTTALSKPLLDLKV